MFKHKVFTLNNGLKVCIHNKKTGLVSIVLKGKAGSNKETLKEVGVAHALEHLVFEKTKAFKTKKHLQRSVENTGGIILGTTSRDEVSYIIKMPSDQVDLGLNILSELFYHPVFTKKNLEKIKMNILEEIDTFSKNAYELCVRKSYELIYKKGRINFFNSGNKRQVEKIKLKEVIHFYRKYYTNDNFILVISGDIEEVDILNKISRYFSIYTNKSRTKNTNIQENNNYVGKIIRSDDKYDHTMISVNGFKVSEKLSTYLIFISEAINKIYPNLVSHSFSSNTYGVFNMYLRNTKIASPKIFYKQMLKEVKQKITSDEFFYQIQNRCKFLFFSEFEKQSRIANLLSEYYLFDRFAKNIEEEIKINTVFEKDKILETLNYLQSKKIKVLFLKN